MMDLESLDISAELEAMILLSAVLGCVDILVDLLFYDEPEKVFPDE